MNCECGKKLAGAYLMASISETEDTDGSPMNEIEVGAECDCGRHYYAFLAITEMQLDEEESCQTDG
ncbi:MAG: hypothetical protein GY749_34500 [Desulfobacteraceae bacterium]|nr:hypothetical protein [Desulfobacteraceae bacterium]